MTDGTDNRERLRPAEFFALGRLTMRSGREGDVHTIRLAGELDLANRDEIERELKRVEASDALSIVIDLSELTFIDSTGIRLLMTAGARSHSDSDRLTLIRGPRSVQRVLEICGICDLLPFAD